MGNRNAEVEELIKEYNEVQALADKYQNEATQIKEKIKHLCESYRAQDNISHLASAQKGSIISYGVYNGITEWIVLEKAKDWMLVISKYAIEERPYNVEYGRVTWEDSSLRSWLNGEYLEAAFCSEENARIIKREIFNTEDTTYRTYAGNNTFDKVFLLSLSEIKRYLLKSEMQAYLPDGKPVWWWLRSPGSSSSDVMGVEGFDSINYKGYNSIYKDGGVRPAMYIDISDL